MHKALQQKIYPSREELSKSRYWPISDKKVVFTNGCFDLLHAGHVDYLMRSKDLGDVLMVGLNSDSSVRNLKGSRRPVQNWTSRAIVLGALQCVDIVVGFGEATPLELIRFLRPAVITKGGDYVADEMVGRRFVQSYGGTIEILPMYGSHSTSGLLGDS